MSLLSQLSGTHKQISNEMLAGVSRPTYGSPDYSSDHHREHDNTPPRDPPFKCRIINVDCMTSDELRDLIQEQGYTVLDIVSRATDFLITTETREGLIYLLSIDGCPIFPNDPDSKVVGVKVWRDEPKRGMADLSTLRDNMRSTTETLEGQSSYAGISRAAPAPLTRGTFGTDKPALPVPVGSAISRSAMGSTAHSDQHPPSKETYTPQRSSAAGSSSGPGAAAASGGKFGFSRNDFNTKPTATSTDKSRPKGKGRADEGVTLNFRK